MSSLLKIPHFIKAKSEVELQRKMLKLQTALNAYIKFEIHYTTSGIVAWYDWDLRDKRTDK